MKPKRKKNFAANNASVKKLEAEGWTCSVTEQTIPHCFIKRDTYGFGDILACSPTRGIMLVQATAGKSTSNFHARVAKLKAEPRHAIWIASGGRIAVHSWEGKGGKRECRVLELTKTPPHNSPLGGHERSKTLTPHFPSTSGGKK